MKTNFLIILIHLILFQGMFFAKNILLSRKLKIRIRGRNREASVAIMFFGFFIVCSLVVSCIDNPIGYLDLPGSLLITGAALILLVINLIVSATALLAMKDSWRVGVIEEQRTELVEKGIFKVSRNPYFVSFLIMFIAYAMLLQNAVLLVLSVIGFYLVHSMILKEESYLENVHGGKYLEYRKRVPRYLIF